MISPNPVDRLNLATCLNAAVELGEGWSVRRLDYELGLGQESKNFAEASCQTRPDILI